MVHSGALGVRGQERIPLRQEWHGTTAVPTCLPAALAPVNTCPHQLLTHCDFMTES